MRREEISLRNGTVVDCSGCPYETCLHFGEKGDCLYGGVMVETANDPGSITERLRIEQRAASMGNRICE